jgi:uncharacterized membrane protein
MVVASVVKDWFSGIGKPAPEERSFSDADLRDVRESREKSSIKYRKGKKQTIMKNSAKISWITQTAILIALLIVAQASTAPLGNTLVTGTLVNLLLVIAAMIGGISSGLTVAVVSPILAKIIGIGPLWALIPFIIAGNMALVLLWHVVGNRHLKNQYFTYIGAMIVAAVGKFIVLYTGIVRIAVPLLLNLPEKQAAVISGMFSVPQLTTALCGGFAAVIVLPALKKAITH